MADPNELFGPQGIYTRYYDEKSINADVKYYDKEKGEFKQEVVELEIKGAGSRNYAQKSFNVKGDVISFALSSGGQDNKFKLSDPIVSKFSEGLNYDYSKNIPCQVFIQGEYWGMYFINDRQFSKKLYAEKYGVKKKTISIIKNGSLNEGEESDLQDYKNIIDFADRNSLSDNANYETVAAAFDIDSLIDYYAMEMFIGNTDWPNNNYAVWRSTEKNDNKWRFILYDTNISSVMSNSDTNMFGLVMKRDKLFRALYDNAGFKEKFIQRYKELIATQLSADATIPIAQSVYESQRIYVDANMSRYYIGTSMTTYDNRFSDICAFLTDRPSKMLNHIINYVPGSYIDDYSGGGGAQSDEEKKDASASASGDASSEPMPIVKVVKTSIKKLIAGKKSFKIRWKKVADADGYRLQYSKTKNFKKGTYTKLTINKDKTYYRVKKLKPNKKYYVRMRSFKTVDGENYYSAWTKRQTIKTK